MIATSGCQTALEFRVQRSLDPQASLRGYTSTGEGGMERERERRRERKGTGGTAPLRKFLDLPLSRH